MTLQRNFRIIISLLFLVLCVNSSFASKREIALTIDDLPFVGEGKNFHLDKIIATLQKEEVTATGFVIAGTVRPDNWKMLHKFKDAGFALGNHTLSHKNLNTTKTDAYIHEIESADKLLSPVMTEPKYFRYPYLAEGAAEKKQKVREFLAEKNYRIAPITIDSNDFVFNRLLLALPQKDRRAYLEVLKQSYLAFIWQRTLQAEERAHNARTSDEAQILLIHANLLNAYVLPDIIKLYQKNGFTFVSLDEALKTMQQARKDSRYKNRSVDPTMESFAAWD